MGKTLSTSERCELFEGIAEAVWIRITRAHSVGINHSEDGITREIIVDILEYHAKAIPNFDVYAKQGWNEKEYGSDLDVFIETYKGQYIWIALQAKILKKNNRYTTLRDGRSGRNPTYQWEKLVLLEAVGGCHAYFLFYNGGESNLNYLNRMSPLFDQCKREYLPEQLGCSIVKLDVVRRFALRKNGLRYQNPTFQEIHSEYSQPWRVLVCCHHDLSKFTIYSLEEILQSQPKLIRLNTNGSQSGENGADGDDEELKGDGDDFPVVEGNRINSAMLEANWNPSLRLIVNRTT